MVRHEILRKRMNKLDEYLAIIRQLHAMPAMSFCRTEHYGSAERFLASTERSF